MWQNKAIDKYIHICQPQSVTKQKKMKTNFAHTYFSRIYAFCANEAQEKCRREGG